MSIGPTWLSVTLGKSNNSVLRARMGLSGHDIELVSLSDLPNITELVTEWRLSLLAPGPGLLEKQETFAVMMRDKKIFQINCNMHSFEHTKYKVHT